MSMAVQPQNVQCFRTSSAGVERSSGTSFTHWTGVESTSGQALNPQLAVSMAAHANSQKCNGTNGEASFDGVDVRDADARDLGATEPADASLIVDSPG
jgi:hypothetical protein